MAPQLRAEQFHSAIHEGKRITFRKGDEFQCSPEVYAFLMADTHFAKEPVFTVLDGDDLPDGGADTEDSVDPETARRAELQAMLKADLGKLVRDRWLALEGLDRRSTKDDIVDAIIAKEAAEVAAAEAPVTMAVEEVEGEPLLIGYMNGEDVVVRTVTRDNEEGVVVRDGLDEMQTDLLEVYETPVDGLASMEVAIEDDGSGILSLIGGVADGRYFDLNTLAEHTLRRFLLEVNSDLLLDELDRRSLVNTIVELEEE